MIAVCLTVHEPDPARLARQLASLDAQEDAEWTLVREDDERGSGRLARLRALLRARRPPGRHVAPCDQDDVWHPSKLATLSARAERGRDARLQRPADRRRGGRVLSPTYWTNRVATWDDLGAELQTNVVTGAACLVRREVLDVALPFPAELAGSFHDHWLAVCALALGDLAYVDRAAGRLRPARRQRGGLVRAPPARRALQRRAACACAPRATASATSSARGCGRARCSSAEPELEPRKRRALERAARAGLPWLAAGALREQLRPRRTLEARRRALRGALWGRGRAAQDRVAGQSAAGSSPASPARIRYSERRASSRTLRASSV